MLVLIKYQMYLSFTDLSFCRSRAQGRNPLRALPLTQHDLIHNQLSQSPTPAPYRRSRCLAQAQEPQSILTLPRIYTSLNPQPPQLTSTNLELIQENISSGLSTCRTYEPPQILLLGVNSYQMGRFLDEIPDFKRTVVVGEAGVREIVRRRKRYRDALRVRVRMLREVIED